jgi:hypothetical protein
MMEAGGPRWRLDCWHPLNNLDFRLDEGLLCPLSTPKRPVLPTEPG